MTKSLSDNKFKQEKITELLIILSEQLSKKSLVELEQISKEDLSDSFEGLLEDSCNPLESSIVYCLESIDPIFEIDQTLEYINKFGKITKDELQNTNFQFWKKWLIENDVDTESLRNIIGYLNGREERYWIHINEIDEEIEKPQSMFTCFNNFNIFSSSLGEYNQIVIREEPPF